MFVRFLLFLLLVYLLYKIFQSIRQLRPLGNEHDKYKPEFKEGEDLVEDPVCHTYVPVSQALKKEISGRDYYFCSKQCSDKYELEKNM
jgi:YHS domain-containing protein